MYDQTPKSFVSVYDECVLLDPPMNPVHDVFTGFKLFCRWKYKEFVNFLGLNMLSSGLFWQ